MNDNVAFEKVLSVFAHYGFRRTSMADLAEAADVSRQTLYNRFKSKEAVLDWAVEGLVRYAAAEAGVELRQEDVPLTDRLVNAFSKWIGESIPVMKNSPHGMEMMDLGIASLQRAKNDPVDRFETMLSEFLLESNICDTIEEARDKTFLFVVASKGLILKSASTEDFNNGMRRIIRSAIPGGRIPETRGATNRSHQARSASSS